MSNTTKHVVMFSGGVGSWAAAKRVAAEHGTRDLTLLFTDTKTEDEDLYRFIREAAADVGGTLVELADGRDIWGVFRDERFLGNSRIAPCTSRLKRDVANKWLAENCDPASTVCYVGIDWTEAHRFDGTPTRKGLKRAKAEQGWTFEAPMCKPPLVAKWQMLRDLERAGIAPPRMYAEGFGHNNCAGMCVKAGIGHWALVWRSRPATFMLAERKEQEMREHLARPVTILTETVAGVDRPLTLRDLRRRLECGDQVDMFAHGGCGCFIDGDPPAEDIVPAVYSLNAALAEHGMYVASIVKVGGE